MVVVVVLLINVLCTALFLLLVVWAYRRRGKSAGGSALTGPWDELFHPSRQLAQQEKERQLVLRDDAETGAPPGSTVDLQSGTAVIRMGEEKQKPPLPSTT
ncbi:DUF6191 domain-containing protein [Streptomyces sp. H27-H1]|uniref:DUF6191 domain-containing protein n=1 Tax=Streptomyces sp. H27-H1 TaxID=2996461 RepID=UPI0022705991|nr:DUF6191 domain-containing protein [Streptomyces sp. H27-H1]MCY0932332.1 DUF6191 domain-containing protein [Streptomyces sp. H27-H1]